MKSIIKLSLRCCLVIMSMTLFTNVVTPTANHTWAAEKKSASGKKLLRIPSKITGTYYYWNVQAQAYEKLVLTRSKIAFTINSKHAWLVSNHVTKRPNMRIKLMNGHYQIDDKQARDTDKYWITPIKRGLLVTRQFASNNNVSVQQIFKKQKPSSIALTKVKTDKQFLTGWHQSLTIDSNVDKVLRFKLSSNYQKFTIGKANGKAYLEDDFNVTQIKNTASGDLELTLRTNNEKLMAKDYKQVILKIGTVRAKQQRYLVIKSEKCRQFYDQDSFSLPTDLKHYYHMLLK